MIYITRVGSSSRLAYTVCWWLSSNRNHTKFLLENYGACITINCGLTNHAYVLSTRLASGTPTNLSIACSGAAEAAEQAAIIYEGSVTYSRSRKFNPELQLLNLN
jgi:hypothetical protein